MTVTEELKKQRDAFPERPSREELEGVLDTIEGQLGYRLGCHHTIDDAIEIAEEEEDA